MQNVDLKTIIDFIQRNWPAVTATAVVLATLLLLKRRKKPAAIASFPDADELPPKRKARFYMNKDDEQDIALSKKGVASKEFCPPNTVFALLRDVASGPKAHLPALAVERPVPSSADSSPLAEWKTWTWSSYHDDVRAAAKGFQSLGSQRFDGIAILGFNAPEWFMAELAAMYFGGKAAGIYPTDTPEQVQYKSLLSDSSVAVVDTVQNFEKFRQIAKNLPELKGIVVWGEAPPVEHIEGANGRKVVCMTWEALLQRGRQFAGGDAALDAAAKEVKPGNCAALVFTSGTTGNPKAVMVSHDNLIFEAACAIGHHVTSFGANKGEQERILSYLPLSHVAGMMVDIIAPLVCTAIKPGYATAYFARPLDLKLGTLKQRLLAVRPTIFLGVPRVWEKFMEGMQAVGKQMPDGLKKKLVAWAKRTMLAYQVNMQVGGSGAAPFGTGIARKLLVKAKQAIGLDQCKFFLTGAAPISTQTLEYFASIGISINEVYGMSECCGATTISTDAEHRWGSIGFSMAGCETRVFRVGEGGGGGMVESKLSPAAGHLTEEEQGEICFRGRHIMMGYLMNPRMGDAHKAEMEKKNKEAIDEDGWLHSGDKASRDTSNMFKITGRYKELIIGAGGENIAPVPIEAGLKRAHGAISNCVMVGDKRKFNVVLVTLKAVGATGERPGTNELEKAAMEHCSAGVATISQAMDDKALIKSLEAAIAATNKNGDICPSNASYMQKFSILPIDLSVETGDITPSLKLKRSELEAKYSKLLDRMFSPENEKESYVRYQPADTAHLTLHPAP